MTEPLPSPADEPTGLRPKAWTPDQSHQAAAVARSMIDRSLSPIPRTLPSALAGIDHGRPFGQLPATLVASKHENEPLAVYDRLRAGPEAGEWSGRPTCIGLDFGICKFPLGAPNDRAEFFCGAPAARAQTSDGEKVFSYCSDHCRIAYVRGGSRYW